MLKNDVIAVTGATGFIGKPLIAALLNCNLSVKVLSRYPEKTDCLFPGNLKVVKGGINDRSALEELLKDAKCIFHLAAEVRDEKLMTAVNVEGTRSLLECLKKRGDPARFIYLSSAGVTGQEKYLHIDEGTPCLPITVYEKTKLEAEIIVNDYCSRNGMLGRILRPTIVFGERKAHRDDSFYQLIRRIKSGKFFLINKGKGIANYVYVGDVVNALIAFMKDDRPDCSTYILNDETDMLTLAGCIKEALGMHSGNLSLSYAPVLLASKIISAVHPSFPLTPARVRAMACQFHYSSEKIKNELGFKFEYGVAEGVKRTVSWLRQENRL